MKREKTWIACDRCGCEIEENPKSLLSFKCFTKKFANLETTTIDEIDAIVNKSVLELESETKVLGMDISYKYRSKTTELNLCPKCQKDFDRFMKGKL